MTKYDNNERDIPKMKTKEYTFALEAGRPKHAVRIARIAALHGVLLMVARRAEGDWFHYFALENAGGQLDVARAEGTVLALGAAGLWPVPVLKGTIHASAEAELRRIGPPRKRSGR